LKENYILASLLFIAILIIIVFVPQYQTGSHKETSPPTQESIVIEKVDRFDIDLEHEISRGTEDIEVIEPTDIYVAETIPTPIKTDYEWLDFTATFYVKNGPGMDGKGITASGTRVKAGRTIAVDTSVIALGTTVYIDGYGYRIAEDTGGAIKGNKIDIYVDSVSDIPAEGIVKVSLRICNEG